MKKLIVTAILTLSAACLFAQNSSIADPNPEIVGNDSAMMSLREISLDRFEREGAWFASMSSDYGLISCRQFEGSPSLKEKLRGDEEVEDNFALGVKVEFFRRGVNSFHITAQRPIPIEGITKTISMWVCGRNQDHELYCIVNDYFNREYQLYMGKLNFSGWRKLVCVVPPCKDGIHGIVQHSEYYGDKPGLKVTGFRVDCNPEQARGTFYMYMDDLRCVTDLYDMENHDEDDMPDSW